MTKTKLQYGSLLPYAVLQQIACEPENRPISLPFNTFLNVTPGSSWSMPRNVQQTETYFQAAFRARVDVSAEYDKDAVKSSHQKRATSRRSPTLVVAGNQPHLGIRHNQEGYLPLGFIGYQDEWKVPGGYILVPQPASTKLTDTGSLSKSVIMFQEYGSPHAGVKVNNVLDVNRGSWLPLEGADDKVLAHFGYREVNITMEWPGYPSAWTGRFTRKIKTAGLTRRMLLGKAADSVMTYFSNIRAYDSVCLPGMERWSILTSQQPGYMEDSLVIAGLSHRGGSSWQIELCALESPFA